MNSTKGDPIQVLEAFENSDLFYADILSFSRAVESCVLPSNIPTMKQTTKNSLEYRNKIPVECKSSVPVESLQGIPEVCRYISLECRSEFPVECSYDFPTAQRSRFPMECRSCLPGECNSDFPAECNSGFPAECNSGFPAECNSGFPAECNSGFPAECNSGFPAECNSGFPAECNSGFPAECNSGFPAECNSGFPAECNSGFPVECNFGFPTEYNYDLQNEYNSGFQTKYKTGFPSECSSDFPGDCSSSFLAEYNSGFLGECNSGIPAECSSDFPAEYRPGFSMECKPDFTTKLISGFSEESRFCFTAKYLSGLPAKYMSRSSMEYMNETALNNRFVEQSDKMNMPKEYNFPNITGLQWPTTNSSQKFCSEIPKSYFEFLDNNPVCSEIPKGFTADASLDNIANTPLCSELSRKFLDEELPMESSTYICLDLPKEYNEKVPMNECSESSFAKKTETTIDGNEQESLRLVQVKETFDRVKKEKDILNEAMKEIGLEISFPADSGMSENIIRQRKNKVKRLRHNNDTLTTMNDDKKRTRMRKRFGGNGTLNKPRIFQCEVQKGICVAKFKTMHHLNHHVTTHQERDRKHKTSYRCTYFSYEKGEFCSVNVSKKLTLERHYLEHHNMFEDTF